MLLQLNSHLMAALLLGTNCGYLQSQWQKHNGRALSYSTTDHKVEGLKLKCHSSAGANGGENVAQAISVMQAD
jgi:hypothetical protein